MARFYETNYIKPNSAYVPLPLDAMAAKLQTMQQAQDTYKQNIEAFDKPFQNLPIDQQSAADAKQWVQGQLEGLRQMDYNDPMNRQQIYSTIKGVRDFYSPQGQAGLLQYKVDQYNANKKHIQDTYKDNPTQMGYLLGELDKQFLNTNNELDFDNKALRKNDSTGQWENTQVGSPSEWTWVDMNKKYNDTLGTIAYDTYKSQNPKWQGTTAEAVSMYFLEGADSLTKQKIDQGMMGAFASDPDVVKSAQAQSNYNGLGTDESQFYNTDANGNFAGWNTNTLLGTMLDNRGESSKFYRDKTEHGLVTDRPKEERRIKKDEEERNAFTTQGTIPGATTSVDAQKNGENIANIKARMANVNQNTAEGKAEYEKLTQDLAIAEAYQKQIMSAGKASGKSDAVINNEWENILETQSDYDDDTELHTSFGQSHEYDALITSTEFRSKVKTKEDYEKWLNGEIKLDTSKIEGYTPPTGWGGQPLDGAGLEAVVKGEAVTRYSEGITDAGGKLNVTYTTNAMTGTGVDKINEKLTNFVLTSPTGFTTQQGSDFQQWKQDSEAEMTDQGFNMEKTKMNVSVLDGDINGRDGYYVTYVDERGNLLKSTVIYPTNAGVASQVKNTVGNDMVNIYENNTTSAGQANLQTGQAMVATSASPAAASANQSTLVNYANTIPDPTVNGTSNTYKQDNGTERTPTTTVVLSNGNTAQIQYNIVKQRDGNGNIITKYQPTDTSGNKIFNGTEGYSGLNNDGTFTNIQQMQIALAKDDLGVAPNQVLKEDNYKVK